ncbi:CoA-binding protein [Chloroflexota bacterium]
MTRDFTKLHRAFNPKSIAIVGDKGTSGFPWLRTLSTFQGNLYSVQTNPEHAQGIKAMGVENYHSVLDISESIDLVIVSVPRAASIQILEDCITKGVAAVHFFTAGFAETGTKEGESLEYLLIERARKAGINLIGPNCMGIFNPKIGLRQNDMQYTGVRGPVGFISQSGTHAGTFAQEGHLHGIDINKSVSFGNGRVLDSTDYLEYFGQDRDIKFIGMYLEGVQDGRQFLAMLRDVSAHKPVVIWKGGQTDSGARAIASHTGSLAVPDSIWDAAVRQYGAISVDSLEELIDTMNGLIHLSPVRGDRVALVGGSGGQSVAIADAFVNAGMRVPLLTKDSNEKLATFFNMVGASCLNPIDPGSNRSQMIRILDIVVHDANIDNVVLIAAASLWQHMPTFIQDFINVASVVIKQTAKPVMAILPHFSTPDNMQQVGEIEKKLLGIDIPSFHSFERGALALANVLSYYKLHR